MASHFERRFGSAGRPKKPIWIIPFVYAAAALVLGVAARRIEIHHLSHLTAPMSTASALAIYSSIATGMITLTGLVYSLVFLTVQFSASAYSPRLVLWISRDPLLYHAIGIFTATFLYAIAAISGVDRLNSGTVPFVSVWLVVILLMASVGILVALVKRVGHLEVGSVLHFTGNFGRRAIETLYSPWTGTDESYRPEDFRHRPITQTLNYSGHPRVLHYLDLRLLMKLAERFGGLIELTCSVGDTVVENTQMLRVYGGDPIPERLMLHALRMGGERTFEQDPKYAIRLLVDIGIRALSPAVNDPATAVQALDQIEDLLVRLGRRQLEIGEIRDRSGALKVVMPVPSWEDFLELALGEIRCYGAANLQVTRRMQALLSDLAKAVPPERRHAIERQRRLLAAAIERGYPDAGDRQTAAEEDREGLGSTRRLEQIPRRSA